MADINILNIDFSEAYWRDLHHKATIAIAQGLAAGRRIFCAQKAIEWADALIEELRKSDEAHGWTEQKINEQLLMLKYNAAEGR